MKTQLIILLEAVGCAVSVVAQDYLEPQNFNITEALLNNGVNVSALPDLQGLENNKRSPLSPCAAAVSHTVSD
jgi:hypothetical protein